MRACPGLGGHSITGASLPRCPLPMSLPFSKLSEYRSELARWPAPYPHSSPNPQPCPLPVLVLLEHSKMALGEAEVGGGGKSTQALELSISDPTEMTKKLSFPAQPSTAEMGEGRCRRGPGKGQDWGRGSVQGAQVWRRSRRGILGNL